MYIAMTNTTPSATCTTVIISTPAKKCYKSKSDNVTTVPEEISRHARRDST